RRAAAFLSAAPWWLEGSGCQDPQLGKRPYAKCSTLAPDQADLRVRLRPSIVFTVMLDPAFVRDHADLVRAALTNRGIDADAPLSALAPLDEKRRALILQVESLKRDQNAAA